MRILVVGAGLIGAATAYHLVRRGHEVTLLERGDGPATGASHANGGMLTPSMADPWNAPGIWRELLPSAGRRRSPMLLRAKALPGLMRWGLTFFANSTPGRFDANTARNLRLAAYSLAGMKALRDTELLDYDASTLGTLKLYRDARALEAGIRKSATLAPGLVEARPLDADGVLALEPGLASIAARIAGGIHFPRDESGDARRFTAQLCEAAVRHGARLRRNAGVLGLERDRRRILGVRTAAGAMPADAVVLAAGFETPHLLRVARAWLPIAPVKGYSITCLPGDAAGRAPPLRVPIVDDALHAAVTPLGGSLRVAGTAEFSGRDTRISPARIENLKQLLRAILPDHADALLAGEVQQWAGLRPMSADGVPCIGAIGPAGLYVNAGHGHLGWTMADGSARLLADLIDRCAPQLDAADYSPRRFG